MNLTYEQEILRRLSSQSTKNTSCSNAEIIQVSASTTMKLNARLDEFDKQRKNLENMSQSMAKDIFSD